MPVASEPFGSSGRFATYDPYVHELKTLLVTLFYCHSCGYEPEVQDVSKTCPRCNCRSWDREVRNDGLNTGFPELHPRKRYESVGRRKYINFQAL